MAKIIYSNSLNVEVTWSNSNQTIKVMVINEKGHPIRACRLIPNQKIQIPPNGHIKQID